MSLLKSIWTICLQNLRKWKTDYRIWAIGILAFIMVCIYVDDIRKITSGLGEAQPIWIYPFLYSQFHTKLIFSLLLVLLVCNAPFIDNNQTFIFMRSGRKKWLCGQILYVVTASGFYYIFLLLASLLCSIAVGGEINLEWGRTLITTANTDAAWNFGVPFIDISKFTLIYFTPISATWFTFLLSWMCGIMIGLIIFFCNIATNTRYIGITISSLIILLSALVDKGLPQILPFSPVSWITVDKVDVGGLTKNPTFGYCIGVYLGLIALLTAGILIFGKRQSMDVKGQ